MSERYSVRWIDEYSGLAGDSNSVGYYQYGITTEGGIPLTVDVPERDFRRDRGAAILERRALDADSIIKLGGANMADKYEVTGIEERIRTAGPGEFTKVYRVTYRTKGGTVLTEDIDEADFTPDKVGVILEKKAAEAEKILEL